jgi:hypothetical protein
MKTYTSPRIIEHARIAAWTILTLCVILICTAIAYLRGTTIGLGVTFGSALIIYECILVLKKAAVVKSR